MCSIITEPVDCWRSSQWLVINKIIGGEISKISPVLPYLHVILQRSFSGLLTPPPLTPTPRLPRPTAAVTQSSAAQLDSLMKPCPEEGPGSATANPGPERRVAAVEPKNS